MKTHGLKKYSHQIAQRHILRISNALSVSFVVLVSLFLPTQMTAQQREYYKITTPAAISVAELLAKYQLDGYDCNLKRFTELNRLTAKTTQLAAKKSYQLPILLYDFRGGTIRQSIGLKDFNQAKRIQSYNSWLLQKKIRTQTYQQSKIIFVPYHELYCAKEKRKVRAVKTTEPTANAVVLSGGEREKAARTYTIFGKKYERTPLIDSKLKGKVFYVESGHGGIDPGARATVNGRTLCEDEYAYDVALRVARNLIMHGATTYIITRDPNDGIRDGEYLLADTDEQTYPDLPTPAPHKERLFQRSDAVNLLYDKYEKLGIKDQRLIVIHVDSRSVKQQTDVFFYYKDGDANGEQLSKKMHSTMQSHYKSIRNYTGTVTSRDLHMLRECKSTSVYVELGNIRNAFDLKRLLPNNNRQAIANWLYDGLVK